MTRQYLIETLKQQYRNHPTIARTYEEYFKEHPVLADRYLDRF